MTGKIYSWHSVQQTGGGDRRYQFNGYEVGEYACRVRNLQELRSLCRDRNVHYPKTLYGLSGSSARQLPEGYGLWFRSTETPGSSWTEVPRSAS